MSVEGSGEVGPGPSRGWLDEGWRGFNRWRRRYWLVRVIILLLIFAPAIVEVFDPRGLLITRLVRIAIDAIRLTHEPRLAYNLQRFQLVEEAQRLRMELWRELDSNGDRALDDEERERALAVGLAPEQLTCPSIHADLEQLGQAARRLNLLPASYSTKRVRRQARLWALGEAERLVKPSHEVIEALLRDREPLDYTKWQTWRRGIGLFFGGLSSVFGMPWDAITWLLGSFLIAGVCSLAVRRHRPTAGFAVGVLVVAVTVCLLRGVRLGERYEWLRWLGYGLLTGAVGHAAGKAAARLRDRLRGALVGGLLLGLLLVGRGATAPLFVALMWRHYGVDVRAAQALGLVPQCAAALAVGFVLTVGAGVGLYVLWRARRAAQGPL